MTYRTLIFDDDENVRHMMGMLLARRGHQVLSFDSPLHCPILKWSSCSSQEDVGDFDFLISDQMMPGMTGLEFLELLEQQGCPLDCKHKALITGSEIDRQLVDQLHCQLFPKPIDWGRFSRWLTEGEALLSSVPAVAH